MKRRALYGLVSTFWVLTIVAIPSLATGAILCVGGIGSTVALITNEAKLNSHLGWLKGFHYARQNPSIAEPTE